MTTATRDVEAAEGRLLAHDHIPHVVVDRLPLYTRALSRLASEGRFRINSRELGDLVDVHPEQIRRDLRYLGHLGKPGLGYDVRLLEAELRRVLGADKTWHTVLVGGGVRAILNYAPVAIHVPERVLVRPVDPITKLQQMTFYLNRKHDAIL